MADSKSSGPSSQAEKGKGETIREREIEREPGFSFEREEKVDLQNASINGGGHYLELGWVCLSVVLLFSFVCFSKGRKRSLSPNDSIRARKRVHTDITIRDKPTYHLSKHCTLKNRRIIILKMNSLSF